MELRQADPIDDRNELRALWGSYLHWVNEECRQRWSIQFPIDEILEQNLTKTSAFEPPRGRLLLAISDSGAVGVGCLKPIRDDTAEIKRMYVRPDMRGTGVGRRLIVELLGAAREAGYRRVLLDSVRFMHAAHGLYRSAGFVEIEPYPESEIPEDFRQHWMFMGLDL